MMRWLCSVPRLLTIISTLLAENALAPLERLPLPWWLRLLLKHGSNRAATGTDGERLGRALQKLGPAFIKAGQMLATRADIIGQAMANDLANLQDRLPPFEAAVAIATIEKELGQPLTTLFSSFTPEAYAAASIAQVHRAVTPDGRHVAVKVLRPGIEKQFAPDIALLRAVADILVRLNPDWARLSLHGTIAVLAESVTKELDLRLEAASASTMAENFKGDHYFRVPQVDWQRTAQRVLTLEWIDGIRINDKAALLAAGHDIDTILAHAAGVFFQQVFRDGFFHADQHPGNLFIDSAGRMVAIDFGIMGSLDRTTRNYLADILIGFMTRDYVRIARVHYQAGWVDPATSPTDLALAIRTIGEPIWGLPLAELSVAKLLTQLFQLSRPFKLQIQPHLFLLQKTMMVTEGVGRQLNPNVNTWQLAQPLIEDWLRKNRGPLGTVKESLSLIRHHLPNLPMALERLFQAGTDSANTAPLAEPVTAASKKNKNNKNQNDKSVSVFIFSVGLAFGMVLAAALTIILLGN